MAAVRVKTFSISNMDDLEKVDSWWAGLLRNGAKEICHLEWAAKGELDWTLKVHWGPLATSTVPFNVCMPAYSSYSIEDLENALLEVKEDRKGVLFHLKMARAKIEEWGILDLTTLPENLADEILEKAPEVSPYAEHLIDPQLGFSSNLDLMEKIIASEFLWPTYKNMKRGLLMLDTKIQEITKEIEHRHDSSYTVVRVDRGMLRDSFLEQIGYDNKWLFATDEELIEDGLIDADEDFDDGA